MIWPRLKTDHPGYFLVALQIIFIHTGLCADALTNRHQQEQWRYVNDFIGFHGWSAIHASIAVIGVVGLYTNLVAIMRTAWLISYIGCLVLAIELGVGDYVAGHSYIGSILLVGVSMSSLAAFRENPVNPAMRVKTQTTKSTSLVIRDRRSGTDRRHH